MTSTPGQPRKPGDVYDEKVEAWLTRRGAHFLRAIEIPLSSIDRKRSRQNQARPTAVVSEAVERYTIALKAGRQFPPIVVYRPGDANTDFVIIDGNNRDESHLRAKKDRIWAYILAKDTPSELIAMLTVEANAEHGQPVPTEWRVKQALHLESIGWSAAEAADGAGISVATLTQRKSVAKATLRARTLKLSGWAALPITSQASIAAFKDDTVFAAGVRAAVDTGMSIDDVKALARSVRDASSEADRLTIIREARERRELERKAKETLGKNSHRIQSPKHSFVTALGKIMAVDIDALTRSILVETENRELRRRAEEAAEKIFETISALDAALRNQVA